MPGCSLASQASKFSSLLLMLLTLKVAIFNRFVSEIGAAPRVLRSSRQVPRP